MAPQTQITLAHSPDADDLVMWWPLTGMRDAGRTPLPGPEGQPAIDTSPFEFVTLPGDIQALNRRAIDTHDLDVTAISAYTYPFVREHYRITACAGSFGDGYGPKIVVRRDSPIMCDGCLRAQKPKFAVPGDRTSAFLALSMLLGQPFDFVVMPFLEITAAVTSGSVDAGLLIHEAQLTFESAGLRQVIDLGAWWKEETGLPLPLGLNVLRRDLDARLSRGATDRIAALLRRSVAHARGHPDQCRRFLLGRIGDRPEWADDALVERYLGMYVNSMTEDMGETGRRAIELFLGQAADLGLAPAPGPIDPI